VHWHEEEASSNVGRRGYCGKNELILSAQMRYDAGIDENR
jgi:hypothetical protein